MDTARGLAADDSNAAAAGPWRGVDRAVVRLLAGPPLFLLLVTVLIALQVRMSGSTLFVLVAALVATWVPLVLALFGAFRGRLEVAGGELQLHYGLELVTRTVALDSAIVERSGDCLRVADDSAAITVRRRDGARVRRGFDLAVDSAALDAIERAVAGHRRC